MYLASDSSLSVGGYGYIYTPGFISGEWAMLCYVVGRAGIPRQSDCIGWVGFWGFFPPGDG